MSTPPPDPPGPLSEATRAVLEALPDGVCVIDPATGTVVGANGRLTELYGWSRERLAAMGLEACCSGVAPYTAAEARRVVDRARAEGPQARDWHGRTHDGRLVWVEVGVRLSALDGCERVVVVVRDSARRKGLEESVDRQNRLLGSLLESLPIGVFMVEAGSGRPLVANPRARELLGRGLLPDATRENLGGLYEAYRQGTRERYPTEEMPIVRAMRGEASHVDDLEVVRPDGTTRLLEIFGSPVLDREGVVQAAIASFVDVTERKRAAVALQAAERRLRDIVEHATNLFYVHTPDHVLRYVSPQSRAFFDCEPEEAMVRWQDFLADTPANQVGVERTQRALETGERQPPYELELRTTGGRELWVEVHEAPVVEDGKVVAIVGSLTDITARRRAQAALEESESRYRTMCEAAFEGIALTDGGVVLDCNDQLARMLGWAPEELIGTLGMDHVAPESREAVAREVGSGRATPYEHLALRRDGTTLPVETRSRLATVGGRSVRFIAMRDVSARVRAEEERRRLDEQLASVQRLEGLGVLAGGVAHHFNNLLHAILGNADLALRQLPADHPVRSGLEEIGTISRRAAGLVQQLLAYSGKGAVRVERLDLSALVRAMADLLQLSMGRRASLRYQLADDLPPVEADGGQLRQVVMNLLTNAAEALVDPAGTVVLATRCVEPSRAELREFLLGEGLAQGRCVELRLADTGCGMDASTRQRVFEPFFTTRFQGRGLGLAAVLGIVRAHRGAVRVESEPGRGTTVTVLLPAAPGPVEALEAPPAAAEPWRGQGLVLLAEDEEPVRVVAAKMLRLLGFTVETARDGVEALEQFRARPAEFACVVLDLTMPRMDGAEALRALRAVRADVPVVLASGFHGGEVSQRFADERVGVVQKPFTLQRLAEALRRAVGG